MKRLLYILLMAALPVAASAQVAKQVEVTKDYVPMVKSAQKLSVIPDMTDTVTMQPDIEYEVTPRSYETSMLVQNFRPATITYWDYNRSRPFYARGAFGVPLTSEADIYVSTYNKDRGYAMAYVNHWGDYRNRRNYLGEKVTSGVSEMSNRVGGRAGLIVRRHMLEVDIFGDQQLRHRYPTTGEKILFGNVAGKIRFGDDFTDLSRWNFNIEVGGNIFGENYVPEGAAKHSQSQADARFELGKLLGGRHIFKIHAGYTGVFGSGALSEYADNTLMAGLRYGVSGRRMEFLIGADYYYDKLDGSTDSPHKIFPYLKISWKNTSEKFVPYVEVDGGVRRHDYGSLLYENPYLKLPEGGETTFLTMPNESVYNGRVGIGGNLGGGVFAYNVSAELSLNDNHLYWFSYDYADYGGVNAYQHSLRIDGQLKFRPVGQFEAEIHAGVYAWENYDSFYSSRPSAEVGAALRYLGRKITAGLALDYRDRIKWMNVNPETGTLGLYRTPSTFCLNLDVEWRINERWAVYAEGRNLAGSTVYDWAYYYYDTAQGLLGVKFTF